MLKDDAIPAYDRAMESCGTGADVQSSDEMLKPGWQNNHFVKDYFGKNTPGQKPAHAPLLAISGEIDPAIPADMTAKTDSQHVQAGRPYSFFEVSRS